MNTTGSTPPPSEIPTEDTSAQSATQDTPIVETKSKRFPVIELFGPVIQGEGSQAGQQTMFVRFGGCDYRCQKCDSMHAVMPAAVQKHANYMTALEIYEALDKARQATGIKWVTFSGGNPAMHKLDELVEMLILGGFYINVETQATLWQDWIANCTMVTVSPKSMGMGEKFERDKYVHFLKKLQSKCPLCVKIVVFSAQDLEFALHVKQITDNETAFWCAGFVSYYLSLGNPYPPRLNMDNNLESLENVNLPAYLLKTYQDLSEEVLADPRLKEFRFLPQLHVLVYGNESER